MDIELIEYKNKKKMHKALVDRQTDRQTNSTSFLEYLCTSSTAKRRRQEAEFNEDNLEVTHSHKTPQKTLNHQSCFYAIVLALKLLNIHTYVHVYIYMSCKTLNNAFN